LYMPMKLLRFINRTERLNTDGVQEQHMTHPCTTIVSRISISFKCPGNRCKPEKVLKATFPSTSCKHQQDSHPQRPNFESFASLIASSSELNFMIGRIGPNASSCIIFIVINIHRDSWREKLINCIFTKIAKTPSDSNFGTFVNSVINKILKFECSIIQIAPIHICLIKRTLFL